MDQNIMNAIKRLLTDRTRGHKPPERISTPENNTIHQVWLLISTNTPEVVFSHENATSATPDSTSFRPTGKDQYVIEITPKTKTVAVRRDPTLTHVEYKMDHVYSALKTAWKRHRCLAVYQFPIMMLDKSEGEMHHGWRISFS